MHDRTDLSALVVYGTLDGFSYKDLPGWLAEVEELCPANTTTFVECVQYIFDVRNLVYMWHERSHLVLTL